MIGLLFQWLLSKLFAWAGPRFVPDLFETQEAE